MKKVAEDRLAKLVEAAFQQAAKKVIKRAFLQGARSRSCVCAHPLVAPLFLR